MYIGQIQLVEDCASWHTLTLKVSIDDMPDDILKQIGEALIKVSESMMVVPIENTANA